MNKKYIIISIIFILLITLIAIINKNSREYIIQDGVMLALTLDGEKINSYPEGTNYGVEINCENGKGKWLVDEWKLAVEEVTGNVICNINFTSNPKTLISKIEEVNVNNNYNSHGYRYSGSNPNNYIWFNNEMWRIIGSIPTCLSASCGTNTTNLVKMIRNQSIGDLSYDAKSSSYTGIWGNNTLYTLLNNYYYGKQNATGTNYCYINQNVSKAKCDYTTIGINPNSYYGKMIKNVYWNTASNSSSANIYLTAKDSYDYERGLQTVSGYIGLMSVSDYSYATNNNYHSTSIGYYNTSEITGSNWLFTQGQEWTSIKSESTLTFLINDTGDGGYIFSYVGLAVRPVVYLDPSVYIISGDGTEGNPYQIGM